MIGVTLVVARPFGLVTFLFGACSGTSYPLHAVPITGGTAEEQDAVRRAVDFFDDASGPGRVELTEIRIVESAGDLGRYSHRRRTVELSMEGPLGRVVRHSLCHALIDQEELTEHPSDPMDDVADWMFSPEYPYDPTLVDSCCHSDEDRWAEAVASMCEHGPYWAADVVRNVCPRSDFMEPDPALTDAVAGFMMDTVWTPFELPDPIMLDPANDIEVDLEPQTDDGEPARIDGTTDPNVVVVSLENGQQRRFDLYSGREVELDLPPVENTTFPTGLPWMYYPPGGGAGVPEGPAAIHGVFAPYPLDANTGTRYLAHDGDAWRFVGDGCGVVESWIFLADDAVWQAWGSGSLRWTPVAHR